MHAAACDAGVMAACGAVAQATASPTAQRQLEDACDSDDGCACGWLADSVAVRDDAERMLDLLERSCRAGARDGCDLLVIVVSLGCQGGDPRSCRIVEEQGLGEPDEAASSPRPRPSPTDQCQEVFRLVMEQVDAERIYVDSPAAECKPAVRSWVARPGIRRWHASRSDRTTRCPGDCGPRDGMRITVTPKDECLHAARRSGTGGSFETYCWSGDAMAVRDAGLW